MNCYVEQVQLSQVHLFNEAMKFNAKDVSSYPLSLTLPIHHTQKELNPLGPIAPKVALLTTYSFVASLFVTKFAHELVLLLVVHECFHSL